MNSPRQAYGNLEYLLTTGLSREYFVEIWSQVVTHTSRSVPLDLSKRIRQAEGALHFRDQKKKNKKPSRKDILTSTL